MSLRGVARRVVLGIGPRAEKYDLAFPRVRPVYIKDMDDGARMARAYPVAAVVISGGSLDQVVTCARELRSAVDPSACIAVIDPNFLGSETALQAAGVNLYGRSWMHVQKALAIGIKLARPRRPRVTPALVPSPALH